jgi:NhaA family Na+:H+ antiporter
MSTPDTKPNTDILASLVLLAVTVLALIVANSAWSATYKAGLAREITIGIAPYAIEASVKEWIKNALMAVFFLFVGLEIKYEFAAGALASIERAVLPFAAAAGGMLVPAVVFLAIVGMNSPLARGWAIPSATDIAFAIGVVGLLGRFVPSTLRAFLLAVAVIDDLGAILVIALFYTGGLALAPLTGAFLCTGALWLLNQRPVSAITPYLLIGVLLWIALYNSGINPTLAGVVVALFVPVRGVGDAAPLHDLAERLKTPVTFLIMPIFAFANAGVSLTGLDFATLAQPVTAAVALGLLVGKPIGITLAVALAVATGHATTPAGTTWAQIMGVGALAGIGFTMSLFVGVLAYGEGAVLDQVRLGVLSGSLASALLGAAILILSRRA